MARHGHSVQANIHRTLMRIFTICSQARISHKLCIIISFGLGLLHQSFLFRNCWMHLVAKCMLWESITTTHTRQIQHVDDHAWRKKKKKKDRKENSQTLVLRASIYEQYLLVLENVSADLCPQWLPPTNSPLLLSDSSAGKEAQLTMSMRSHRHCKRYELQTNKIK